MAAIEAICRAEGATYVAVTDDPDEGEMFMQARREAFPAFFDRGTTLIEDVGVPIPRIAELVVGVERVAEQLPDDDRHRGARRRRQPAPADHLRPRTTRTPCARAEAAFAAIVELALSLGGTLTGEHGVGVVKAPFLAAQLGPEVVEVTRRIKDALDPLGILNPGKMFD